MKTITVSQKSWLIAQLPTILQGFIAMWKYRKHGYGTFFIFKSTLQGYFKMKKRYKGNKKEKRVDHMLLFAKDGLLSNNNLKIN